MTDEQRLIEVLNSEELKDLMYIINRLQDREARKPTQTLAGMIGPAFS